MAVNSEPQTLAALQAIYDSLLVEIVSATDSGAGPNMSVDGVSLQDQSYIQSLYDRLAVLQKIPGVARTPAWEVVSRGR